MVQMDFLGANHVRIVGLCKCVKNAKAHRADIFAIAQFSCIPQWSDQYSNMSHRSGTYLDWVANWAFEGCIT